MFVLISCELFKFAAIIINIKDSVSRLPIPQWRFDLWYVCCMSMITVDNYRCILWYIIQQKAIDYIHLNRAAHTCTSSSWYIAIDPSDWNHRGIPVALMLP